LLPRHAHALLLALTDNRPKILDSVDVTVLGNPEAVEVRESIMPVRVEVIPEVAPNIPDNEGTGSAEMTLDKLILLKVEPRFKAVNSVVISLSKVANKELREGVVTVTLPEPPPIPTEPEAEAEIAAKIELMVLVTLVAALSTVGKEDRGRAATILLTLTLFTTLRVDNNEVISASKSLT